MFFRRSDWLLKVWIFSAIHYFTLIEGRQIRVSYEQSCFPVCCRNKERNYTNNQTKYTKEVTKFVKFGLFDKKLSMKPVKGVFVYKCKLSIALIYSAGMFLNKLKTKFNSFQQNGFKYKKNSLLLLTKFPQNG